MPHRTTWLLHTLLAFLVLLTAAISTGAITPSDAKADDDSVHQTIQLAGAICDTNFFDCRAANDVLAVFDWVQWSDDWYQLGQYLKALNQAIAQYGKYSSQAHNASERLQDFLTKLVQDTPVFGPILQVFYPTPVYTGDLIRPGGVWISPNDGTILATTGQSIHFSARAYPTNPSDPPIDHVNFTAWWPARGSDSSNWQIVCVGTRQGDTYQCDWTLPVASLVGDVKISFDVYDNANPSDVNYAPNGIRTIHYGPSATWVSPSNGQTINSQSVHLQANASGGANTVYITAKYAGGCNFAKIFFKN